MTTSNLNLGDQLKQQLISTKEAPKMSTAPQEKAKAEAEIKAAATDEQLQTGTYQKDDLDDEDDDLDGETAAEEVQEETEEDTVEKVFGGKNAQKISINVKVYVHMVAQEVDLLPPVVKVDGNSYSVKSPFRKQKRSGNNDSYGLIRDSLNDTIAYLAEATKGNVVFFGDGSDIEHNIQNMLNYFNQNVYEIMYANFGGDSVKIRISLPGSTGPDLNGVTTVNMEQPATEVIEVSLDNAFTLNCWLSISLDEHGNTTLTPVFAFNVRVPLLIGYAKLFNALKLMSTTLHNTGESSGLGASNVIVSYGMNSADILDETHLNMFNDYADMPGAQVISASSIKEMSQDRSLDTMGIMPYAGAYEEEDLIKLFLPFDTDMMLILPSEQEEE